MSCIHVRHEGKLKWRGDLTEKHIFSLNNWVWILFKLLALFSVFIDLLWHDTDEGVVSLNGGSGQNAHARIEPQL